MIHQQVQIPPQRVSLPTLNQNESSDTPLAPVGGFYTLRRLAINEPVRAFNYNLKMNTDRAQGTVPIDAMTPDIYSAFWSRV